MKKVGILIVEDEAVVAASLGKRLEQLGYEIIGTVASGEEAIPLAERLQPALALVDIKLHGEMDGIAAATDIHFRIGIPVVYLTAFSDQETLQRAKLTEPYGIIYKPFDISDLRGTIEMALYKHKLEKKLKESEARYRTVSELVSDTTYSVRIDTDGGQVFEWATGPVFGFGEFDPTANDPAKQWMDMIHPEDMKIVGDHVTQIISGKPHVSEFRAIGKDGNIIWLRSYARPEWSEEQKRVVRIIGAVQIITEQKTAEEKLKRQADYLAALQDITVGLIGELDLPQLLEATTLRAAELAETQHICILLYDESIQELTLQVGTGKCRNLLGQQQATLTKMLKDLLGKGQPYVVLDNSIGLKGLEDQSWIRSLAAFPLISSENDTVGLLLVIIDEENRHLGENQLEILNRLAQLASVAIKNARLHTTTQREIAERKQVEEALRQSEEKYRAVVEDQTEVITRWKADGTITFINNAGCRLWGRTREDILKLRFNSFVYKDDLALVKRNLSSLTPENPINIDENRTIRNGEIRWFQWTDRAFFDQEGRVIEYQSVGRDITELRKITEDLLASQKLAGLGTLAAGVAHEINSPLQVITGQSERLLGQLKKGIVIPHERMIDSLEAINRNGWRSADIVRSLATYAEASTDGGIEKKHHHNLNSIVQDTLLLIENQISLDSGIEIVIDLEPGILPFACDRSQIIQALILLIHNAKDAINGTGEIIIRTRYDREQKCYLVQVSDTGKGIPEEIKSRIFDPFFTTKPLGKGKGLGLSIVMGIVRSHGGTISVESNQDHGTTFTLTFPEKIINNSGDGSSISKNQGRFG